MFAAMRSPSLPGMFLQNFQPYNFGFRVEGLRVYGFKGLGFSTTPIASVPFLQRLFQATVQDNLKVCM